jgi:arylsulfatase A-like enzyme
MNSVSEKAGGASVCSGRRNHPRPRSNGHPGVVMLRICWALWAEQVTFDRHHVASAQWSSSRSVLYTGQHMPLTEIYDNDNMPYIRPLDPALGTLGSMLRTAGYYCAIVTAC